jgi:hypothetical protein
MMATQLGLTAVGIFCVEASLQKSRALKLQRRVQYMDENWGVIFGSYALEIRTGKVYFDGKEICKLPPQERQILIELIQKRGSSIVGTDIPKIMGPNKAQLTQNRHFQQAISRLWLKLGEESKNYIIRPFEFDPEEPKKGYRFVGEAQFTPSRDIYFDQFDNPTSGNKGARGEPEINDNTVLDLAEQLQEDGRLLIDPQSFLHKVIQLKDQSGRLEQLSDFGSKRRRIRQLNLNTELLQFFYPDQALSAEGLARYAIKVVVSEHESKIITTNVALTREGLNIDIPLKKENKPEQFLYVKDQGFSLTPLPEDKLAEHLANAWLTRAQARNDPVFCLQDFSPKNPKAPMSFTLARYFDYRLTWGALDRENTQALIANQLNPTEVFKDKAKLLPRRCELLPDPAAILHCRNRIAVGGVNVLLALRRKNREFDDYAFFVDERSNRVAFAQGEQSTIPSGFHAVLVERDAWKSANLWQSVFRELGEELFGRDEAISHGREIHFELLDEAYPALYWFADKGNSAQTEHYWVSFGFDIIDGSYQFSILLVVHDPQYWEDFEGEALTNYEYKNKGREAIQVSTKDKNALVQILTNPLCAHTTVFTIVPALQKLAMLAPGCVDLPEIEVISRW